MTKVKFMMKTSLRKLTVLSDSESIIRSLQVIKDNNDERICHSAVPRLNEAMTLILIGTTPSNYKLHNVVIPGNSSDSPP